jgi:RimJ/RimL family protein N-acetyltransferase
LHFAIARQDEGDYPGEILLFLRTAQAAGLGAGEIAYVTAPAARGRGIAPAAVDLPSKWAFLVLGLARVQLSIAPGNTSSVRVAEKARYRYDGLLRSLKVIWGELSTRCPIRASLTTTDASAAPPILTRSDRLALGPTSTTCPPRSADQARPWLHR